MALLSRELVRLDRNVPIDPIGTPAAWAGSIIQQLAELFASLAFARSASGRRASTRATQTGPTASTAAEADYQLVDTPAKLAELVIKLGRAATNQRRHRNDARHAALGRDRRLLVRLRAGRGVLRPGPRPGRRDGARSGRHARRAPAGARKPDIAKIGQNLKYDMIVLRNVGVELAGAAFDTMVASYLLDAGERNHNLDDLASGISTTRRSRSTS